MNPQRNDKEFDELVTSAIGRDDLNFDFDKWKAEHQAEIAQYNAQSRNASGPILLSAVLRSRIGKIALAAAALMMFAVLLGRDSQNIAWADVVEKFRSVSFFSAAIYIKDNATAEPTQMEFWMSRDGRIRIRMGNQVIFGRDGAVVKAFDIQNEAETEPDEMAVFFLERMGRADEFSLEAVIKVMFQGQMQEVTPLVNPNAVISQDVVVFDVDIPQTPEWVRIWALRESRLPVRIKVWDPRDGASTDAVFEYSQDQSGEFFDPAAFGNLLRSDRADSRANVVYAFLQDPGGRNITPEEMFQESGYHMPVVKQAGMTPEGAFWVTAGNSRNRMPNGNVFDGFSRIEDDLGRTYLSVGGGHRLKDDTSLDIFAPIDYPFDDRMPGRITLFCEVENHDPYAQPELIGTVDLTQWRQNAGSPSLFGGNYADPLNLKISLGYKLFGSEHADKLARLVESMPDWAEQPENKSLLFFHMRLASKRDDIKAVVRIGETLEELIFENPERESRYGFKEYLIALAQTGQIERAAELFRRIEAAEAMSPEKSDERYYRRFLLYTAEFLAAEAELDAEQISRILGFDISQKKEYEPILERAKRTAAKKKAQQAAEQRLWEISEYYRTHPLPERMELLERPQGQAVHLVGVSNVLPGHEEYTVLPINYAVGQMASAMKYFDKVHPDDLNQIRIEAEAAKRELYADLICKSGVVPRERVEFVLGLFGMQLVVEEGEPRSVLVARYDGRPLKDHAEVKAPYRYDPKRESKAGMMSSMARPGFSMTGLLEHLVMQQNRGIENDSQKLVIIDETGIEGPVSIEKAFWPGEEGLRLAKQWFEENFGVTFTEESRSLKTYVVCEKE